MPPNKRNDTSKKKGNASSAGRAFIYKMKKEAVPPSLLSIFLANLQPILNDRLNYLN